MNRSIRIATVLSSLALAGGLLSSAPAIADPTPSMTIDRPTAGKLYVNDVEQPGQIQQIGDQQSPAVSIGSSLTIKSTWACPPRSTGASVDVTVWNGNTMAFDAGTLSTGPSGTRSTSWPHPQSGSFLIHSFVSCWHFQQQPGGGVFKVLDGNAEDWQTVLVAAQ